MLDLVRIGQKLKDLRVNANISQNELADMLYCTRQAISRWEQGLGLPTIDNMCELIKIYNISLDELLCMDEDIEIDQSNIFLNHNRDFIIKQILQGKIIVNLADVFY